MVIGSFRVRVTVKNKSRIWNKASFRAVLRLEFGLRLWLRLAYGYFRVRDGFHIRFKFRVRSYCFG
jgi:hypothetical protein